jgi:hypothetical protein
MRNALYISAFVFAAMAGMAAAGTKQSAKVEIVNKSVWSGTPLAPGRYEFAWDGDSGVVKVTILQGGKVVAQGQGRLEERKDASDETSVRWHRDASGGAVLSEVRFAKKTTVLVLAGS